MVEREIRDGYNAGYRENGGKEGDHATASVLTCAFHVCPMLSRRRNVPGKAKFRRSAQGSQQGAMPACTVPKWLRSGTGRRDVRNQEFNGDPAAIRTRDPQIRKRARLEENANQFCKTPENADEPNQYVSKPAANQNLAVTTAALWLSQHRHTLPDPIIPAVRTRFGLSIMDAVRALQIGYEIAYGGGNGEG